MSSDDPLSPNPSPSSSIQPSPYSDFTTYDDSDGRFSFAFPRSWAILTASSDTVSLRTYDPTVSDGQWDPNEVKVDVFIGHPDEIEEVQDAQMRVFGEHKWSFRVLRPGDPDFEGQPGLQIFAEARLVSGDVGYLVALLSGNDPPDVDVEAFWEILRSFQSRKTE